MKNKRTNKYFLLFSECIPIKGFNRSIIYDLNRRNYDFIPNEMYEFLIKFHGVSFKEIYRFIDNDSLTILEEYLNFLLDNEYVHLVSKKEIKWFPRIDNLWEYPSIISNCTIDVKRKSNHDYIKILFHLNILKCHNLCIRFLEKFEFFEIKEILSHFDVSNVKYIEVFLPYFNSIKFETETIQFCKTTNRVYKLTIFNSPVEKKILFKEKVIFFDERKIFDKSLKISAVNKRNLRVNIYLFFESMNFNSYYNKRLAIDSDGFLMNCTMAGTKFGHANVDNFYDVVEKAEFQKLWYVKKENIIGCQDCEFRYMCVDSRPIYEIENNLWKSDILCNYNPYSNEWK